MSEIWLLPSLGLMPADPLSLIVPCFPLPLRIDKQIPELLHDWLHHGAGEAFCLDNYGNILYPMEQLQWGRWGISPHNLGVRTQFRSGDPQLFQTLLRIWQRMDKSYSSPSD